MTSADTLPELFAANPDPPVDRAALVLARDAFPQLSVEDYLRRLNEMSMPLVARLTSRPSLERQAEEITRYVYDELGFAGDSDSYYDPRNRYLNTVLDRRRGIPITLAAVIIALGERAGLHIEGVGFPGHFLVRLGGSAGLYLDPFARARILDRSALEDLARRFLGDASRLAPEHLAPVGTRAIVVRMLTNLKAVYSSRREHAQALVVCDRLVDLAGGPEQRRDRGVHAIALGAYGVGTADLEAYLEARPAAADVDHIRTLLERARSQRRAVMQ